MTEQDRFFMKRAIELAETGMNKNEGGPFGCVVVKDGIILGESYNSVISSNDPTAHAEIIAIRQACNALNSFQLKGCTIYSSCEPCPMCLGAIYWARPDKVYYACDRNDAAYIEFDDQYIYDEMSKGIGDRSIQFVRLLREDSLSVFKKWRDKEDKTCY
jgi:tRNA(Arg) A34 adenosine deaminase TadA